MKNIFSIYTGYFLLIFILIGCGIADPVSNSAGPSIPSNIIMNLKATPPSVPVGGQTIITVTLLYADTGVPAAGFTVGLAASATFAGDDVLTTGPSGQIGWILKGISVPTTFTFVVAGEGLSASIRINISG